VSQRDPAATTARRRASFLERSFRRLGARYPRAALVVVLHVQDVVLVSGVGVVALYLPMSIGEFALLALAAVVAQEVYSLVTLRYLNRRLGSLKGWLEAGGGEEGAAAAWREAASLPYELLRLSWLGGYPLAANLGWALVAALVLDQPAYAIPVLFATALVGAAYGNLLGLFLMERALQPVLDRVAKDLSEEAVVEAISFPLRRRLLALLPALNIITGVAVVGFVEGGDAGVGTLAAAVGISVAVALTLTFLLSFLLASSVVAPIRRLQNATAVVAAGDLTARVPVVASDETGTLTRAFNRMVTGLDERERLREAFGTFVDPGLTARVLEKGTDFAGEEVELSLLFMDIRGFTTYSETADARDVVARLNDLYGVVVPTILRHRGHANKFIGDGLLAVFGAPDRLPDHADRAVAAGLDIARLVRDRYRGELRVGIGVNTGHVVVGTIGGGGRLDFTVIGDAVNTAARVESATRQTDDDLLITGATRQALSSDREAWEERPRVGLKGKAEEVVLYASRVLDSERAAGGPTSSGAPRYE
jgi:adenylate cyclase